MKKYILRATTDIISHDLGSRKLILRSEVIRQLSRQTLQFIAGAGNPTDSDRPGSCGDPTQ